MGSYLTLHINITFKENIPTCISDFFTKGTQDKAIPIFLYQMGLNFSNKIDLTTPDMLITEYGAKTYTDGKPNNRLRLQLTQEFDLDAYILSVYPFITFVATYAEDDCMAGYIKSEMQDYDAFAIKNGIVHWQHDQQIEIVPDKKLDYFELVALGSKIKNYHGSQAEIKEDMAIFDKNIPYPNGSNLLIDNESKNLTIEEIVEQCLDYNE
jgi:hypothetical protein